VVTSPLSKSFRLRGTRRVFPLDVWLASAAELETLVYARRQPSDLRCTHTVVQPMVLRATAILFRPLYPTAQCINTLPLYQWCSRNCETSQEKQKAQVKQ